MNRIVFATLLIAFTACVDQDLTDDDLGETESDATVPVATTDLIDGQSITISGAAGSSRYFKVVVASGYDHFSVWAQSGYHPDVYVRRGALPSTTSYDCTGNGGCKVDYPAGGTYYILVRATTTYTNMPFTAATSDTYSRIANNSSHAIWNQYGYDIFYKLDVPAGTAQVSFKLTLDPSHYGSVDLGVAIGHFVEEGYHCWREMGFYVGVMTATCAFVNPPAGTYYVALNGHNSLYQGTFQAWYSWPLTTGTLATK